MKTSNRRENSRGRTTYRVPGARQLPRTVHQKLFGTPTGSAGAVSDFAWSHLEAQHITKWPDLDPSLTPWETAVEEWVRCELVCQRTNIDKPFLRLNGHEAQVLHLAREKCRRVLGDVPGLRDLAIRLGPGMSIGSGIDVSPRAKLIGKSLSTTVDCLRASFRDDDHGALHANGVFQVVPGSRLSFVPKNARTHRPICIEPTLNSMYQLGIGSFLKDRFVKFGLDLYSQDHNRRLCFNGGLSTVDFKSASDTIAYEVVKFLLPWEWFVLLSTFRSECYTFGDVVHPFEKFSSMGNGFTFELESLIFWALACACHTVLGVRAPVSVFGDDVLLHPTAFQLYHRVVTALGFEVNVLKSSPDPSLFRESCGLDMYGKSEITPFRVRRSVRTVRELFSYHNRILEYIERVRSFIGEDRLLRLLDVGRLVYESIPQDCRFHGPKSMGDDVLHGRWTPVRSRFCRRLQRKIHYVRVIRFVPLIKRESAMLPPGGAILVTYLAGRQSEETGLLASTGHTMRGEGRLVTKTVSVLDD